MMRRVITLVTTLSLALSLATVSFAEDTTRTATNSAERIAAQKALREAKEASQSAQRLSKFKESANKFIDERIAVLNKLISRINSEARLTSTDKSSILADLNTAVTGLQNLKTKIASDTDVTTIKADIKSIFDSFKVFAVTMPKAEGLAAAAKMRATVTKLQSSGDKIKALLDKAQAAGKDTTAMQALYTDYLAKVALAKTNIEAARVKFLAMTVSDQVGSRALFEDGKKLLKTAKDNIIDAHKDLQKIIPLLRVIRGEKPATSGATPATSSGIKP
jgi:hypothetical protein